MMGMLGWAWNARTPASTGWTCPTGAAGQSGPLMIRYYAGTPTVMGAKMRTWFLSKAGNP